jgi:hypothetical protein
MLVLADAHAVVALALVGPDVVPIGVTESTPVNDERPIPRPLTVVLKFAVMAVPDASPEGAYAHARPDRGLPPECFPWTATVHVRPPPVGALIVAVACHNVNWAMMTAPDAIVASC